MLISDLTERALIARIHQHAPSTPDWIPVGIGDDAAAVVPMRSTWDVLTTDALVEGVHFRRDWASPQDIGHKALAVNLSDLAAMGATPRAILMSLALPADLPLADFDGLITGVVTLASASRAPLVGGNISRSPAGLQIHITAMGAVRPRRLMRRSGARPGDRLFVTGTLGAAAAGLALLASGRAAVTDDEVACVTAQTRPVPRLRTGIVVANNRAASACMDLSDGLADAVRQVCEAGDCGATLEHDHIPVHPGATATQALQGGEDYELLFAVPRRRVRRFLTAIRQAGETAVTEIGECTKARDVNVPDGFRHF